MSHKREEKQKLMSKYDRINSLSSSSKPGPSKSSGSSSAKSGFSSPLSSPSKYGRNESTPPRPDRHRSPPRASPSWRVDTTNSQWKRDDQPKPGFVQRIFQKAEPGYRRLDESPPNIASFGVRRRIPVKPEAAAGSPGMGQAAKDQDGPEKATEAAPKKAPNPGGIFDQGDPFVFANF